MSVTKAEVVSSRTRHAGGVLQSDANDLRRIDDAAGDQIGVLIAIGIVAVGFALHLADAIHDHCAVDAGVFGNATAVANRAHCG